MATKLPRPAFIDMLSRAYKGKRKSVVLLTGDTLDLFWNPGGERFLSLEQALYQELREKFTIVRFDAATGISFYNDHDETEIVRVCLLADVSPTNATQKLGKVQEAILENRHQPLPSLVLLRGIADGFTRAARGDKTVKPLCVIVRMAGALFPAGDFDRLGELDRQKLVEFINFISDPVFVGSQNLVILEADTRAEVNRRIMAVPSTEHIEIPLPDAATRRCFVETFMAANPGVELADTVEDFVATTAGLKLTSMADMLEVGLHLKEKITRAAVLEAVNVVVVSDLGDIIKVKRPEHGLADVVGNKPVMDLLMERFKACDNPATAFSAILLSGPNGGGKSFRLEAVAAASGRLVIELTGLRDKWFGGTDKLTELLYFYLGTYGRVLIDVDEAHTAFGSVHKSDTHETERRLGGNIIKMMGDPKMRGKVLWALATSRPDELDPDVRRRASIQIPIFDPDEEERPQFVRELLSRKGVTIADADFDQVLELTKGYSASNFDDLVKEVKIQGKPIPEVLKVWRASTSIAAHRRMQSLIAAQHCSYPGLLPKWIAEMDPQKIAEEVETLKLLLLHR